MQLQTLKLIFTTLFHSSYIGGSLFSLRCAPISADLSELKRDCGRVQECSVSASLTSDWVSANVGGSCVPLVRMPMENACNWHENTADHGLVYEHGFVGMPWNTSVSARVCGCMFVCAEYIQQVCGLSHCECSVTTLWTFHTFLIKAQYVQYGLHFTFRFQCFLTRFCFRFFLFFGCAALFTASCNRRKWLLDFYIFINSYRSHWCPPK